MSRVSHGQVKASSGRPGQTETLPNVVIWIIMGLLLLMYVMNRVVKAKATVQGHTNCAYCRARLKFLGVGKAGNANVKAGYATTCSKCGKVQPWA